MHFSCRFLFSHVKNCLFIHGHGVKVSCLNMSTGRPKVFVTRSDYPEAAIKLLREHTDVEMFNGTNIKKEEIIKGIKGKDALYCSLNDKLDKEVIDAGDKLKVIGTMSVGLDHIDWKLCKEKCIKIGYTPDVLTQAVSELGMALLLATSRRLFEAHNEIVKGGWSSWSPMWMCGSGLHESTFGIVGFGNIGSEIARKVKPFQVARILYTDASAQEKPAAAEVGACKVSLEELLEESDFVMVTCALTEQTKGLFNKEKFALMKPTAIFINISRGGTVVQDDLQEALECNVIRAAGLDVMTPEPLPKDHPLVSLPNCVTLPHIGSATERARVDMGILTTNNIIAGLQGKPLPKEWNK